MSEPLLCARSYYCRPRIYVSHSRCCLYYTLQRRSVVLCVWFTSNTFFLTNARRHFRLSQEWVAQRTSHRCLHQRNSTTWKGINANNKNIELLVSTFLSKYFSFDFICAFEMFSLSILSFVKFPEVANNIFFCLYVDSVVRCCVSSRVEDVNWNVTQKKFETTQVSSTTRFHCFNVGVFSGKLDRKFYLKHFQHHHIDIDIFCSSTSDGSRRNIKMSQHLSIMIF